MKRSKESLIVFLSLFFSVSATTLLFQNCSPTLNSAQPQNTNSTTSSSSNSGQNTGGSTTPVAPTPLPAQTPVLNGLAQNFWNTDISSAAVDSQSATIVSWWDASGGWGTGRMQVDFSFHVLKMDASTPFVSVVKNADFYMPDSDNLATFPLPVGGAVEGHTDYICANEDCHILVYDKQNQKLYESYISSVVSGKLTTTGITTWDLKKSYSTTLRGDQCTSADAAGFPIAPLLFNADEVFAGEINHAIRFILPNNKMAKGVYVRPATHAGAPSGPVNQAVPYGARFRLKASFDISNLKPAARVVAKAMKKYGIALADGGNIAITAESDVFTTHKWSEVDFGALDLSSLKVTDFEMIESGARIPLTYDCVRN